MGLSRVYFRLDLRVCGSLSRQGARRSIRSLVTARASGDLLRDEASKSSNS